MEPSGAGSVGGQTAPGGHPAVSALNGAALQKQQIGAQEAGPGVARPLRQISGCSFGAQIMAVTGTQRDAPPPPRNPAQLRCRVSENGLCPAPRPDGGGERAAPAPVESLGLAGSGTSTSAGEAGGLLPRDPVKRGGRWKGSQQRAPGRYPRLSLRPSMPAGACTQTCRCSDGSWCPQTDVGQGAGRGPARPS